jgi:outer membrane lipopolysaccharide assembly protein LptE/RlpB
MRNAEFGFRNFNPVILIFNLFFLKFRNPQSAIRNYIKVLSSILVILLAGCGYQMVGKETHVPPGINSIAIPTFVNQTFEPGIEVPFTQGFLREFIQDRRVKVVGRDEADSVLEGIIKSFQLSSVSYDQSGIALEYQTTVVIDLTLKKKTGEIIWVEKNLSDSRFYRTSRNILVSESNKAAAIQSLAKFMAERIRNRFFYNF